MSTESQVRRYDDYIESITGGGSCKPYDWADIERCIAQHIWYMLNRTQSMFEWQGLPESIPQRSLELYLQVNGYVGIAKHNGELYALRGGRGGEPDPYYMPTIYTVANPALNWSDNLDIGKNCVVIPNDALYIGLMPMMRKYATAISEVELSIDVANVNSRLALVMSAQDDRTRESALKMLGDLRVGKPGVVADSAFLEGIKTQPGATAAASGAIRELIELLQYQRANWYHELGLDANYNMKREALNSQESALNDDILYPMVDDMLKRRREGAEAVNQMFGTSITVDLASSWKDNKEQVEEEIATIASDGAEDGVQPQNEVLEQPVQAEDQKEGE